MSDVNVDEKYECSNIDSVDLAPRCPLGPVCAMTQSRSYKSTESSGIQIAAAGLTDRPFSIRRFSGRLSSLASCSLQISSRVGHSK